MNLSCPASATVSVNPHRPALVARLIEGTFADRTWLTRSLEGVPCFQAFFLHHGAGRFEPLDGAPIDVAAPQILWLPLEMHGEFRVRAGADGATLLASQDLVWRTVGDSPLGSQLRPLVDRALLSPSERLSPRLAEICGLFEALARESREPGPGAQAMATLYLGLLFMHLWRFCGSHRESEALNAGAPTAWRFRQLVELRYRENLGIDDFARLLGVTRSHLHNACVRALGRAPGQVVHERLFAEARLRLRESTQTVEQVGYGLGFRDPAYFNRFFRRLSGLSPGAYRNSARVAPPQGTDSYAAWP